VNASYTARSDSPLDARIGKVTRWPAFSAARDHNSDWRKGIKLVSGCCKLVDASYTTSSDSPLDACVRKVTRWPVSSATAKQQTGGRGD